MSLESANQSLQGLLPHAVGITRVSANGQGVYTIPIEISNDILSTKAVYRIGRVQIGEVMLSSAMLGVE